ncbi:telomere-associated protein RIF1 [Vigna unguiculata]|uniref:Telomere-associated protein RIF1 n=1 Tax=Vigna unguiculata TaxID=3917 RepID=A0A4D6KYA0_VIGUN|nr:telomere-associated protein RIF1 [Vigna unguiculata]
MSEEIQEIRSLISSNDKFNKSSGYSSLLQFQQHSCVNASSLQFLAHSAQSIISSIVSDIVDDHDEEIATQALKCLGFMLYHPSIVSVLRVDDVNLVLSTLPKLITTTKLKARVWCLSVQQLDATFLVTHFHYLLRAIVHALDNPMGSLSTTFEATQAIMKLSGQLSEQMKGSSHVWAPPIYRRLLSTDKRERDASERCLLKIRSTVIPPSLDLSKVIIKDMKIKLLSGMKVLLENGMKTQAVCAWGWFVRMLGSHALKSRHLVNDMLKIPERTFTDLDPQVQIATLVAWEGLIDALVHGPMLVSEKNASAEENSLSGRKICDDQANGLSKSIKLIMTPLIGIMSSKCDVSVHSSCLNTWCYLLHKLDISVNEPSMIKIVLEPILKSIFQNGPDSKNICLWSLGLDLLTDSISQKSREVLFQSTGLVSHRNSENGHSQSGKCSWKQHQIRWMPWNINQLDFYLSTIFHVFHQASLPTVTYDHRSHVYDAALKLFIHTLKGVKLHVESPSTNYGGIMQCLTSLITFIKKVCEDSCSDVGENYDIYCTSVQFVDAITKELGPSILGSPLYKISLDLKYFEDTQSVDNNKHLKFLSVTSVSYMDKVSPLVYLIALYFYMMVQLTMKSHQTDHVSQGMCEYFKFMFSSSDPLEDLLTSIIFLYRHVQPIYLNIWVALAQGLNYCVSDPNCKSLQEALSDSTVYSSICHLLIYPILALSEVPRMTVTASGSLDKYFVSPERKPRFELVIQTWKALHGSLCTLFIRCSSTTNFSGDLCLLLSSYLDENSGMVESGADFDLTRNDVDLGFLHLSGNFLICILEQIQTLELVSELDRSKFDRDRKILFCITNCLKFVTKYMNLLRTKMVRDPVPELPGFVGTSRLYSALACFISCLHGKQDILHFLKIVSFPLLEWLSNMGMQDDKTNNQLQLLWTEILSCLRRSQPPINFGSALLKLHEPLLEKTLNHPYPSISEPTINFWNSTFGEQIILDFPSNLLCVLDRLSRNGRLKLQKRSLPCLEKCQSPEEAIDAPQGYKVSAKHNSTSKRVELVLDTLQEAPPLSCKKRRLELTEHQREVRRAQLGRERDTGGHGPGIRTYTSADFTQGNDDSQESQEEIVRDPEAILQMLLKTI